MKAVILNSGIGSRMGGLTDKKPKCLIELSPGETVLSRQIKLLLDNGIKRFLITTGPFGTIIEDYLEGKFPGLGSEYVVNEEFASTNYIYSMHLAGDKIREDILLLHGDLVFSGNIVKKILAAKESSCVLLEKNAPLPEKDFKGRIKENLITEIGLNVFGDNCRFLLPFYKLSKAAIVSWMNAIDEFVASGQTKVYAENAFNEHSDKIKIAPLFFSDDICMEIDTLEDLAKAKSLLGN